jgi:hypothetical protein
MVQWHRTDRHGARDRFVSGIVSVEVLVVEDLWTVLISLVPLRLTLTLASQPSHYSARNPYSLSLVKVQNNSRALCS